MDKRDKVTLVAVALPDTYVEHGNVAKLKSILGIDAMSIVNRIKTLINK